MQAIILGFQQWISVLLRKYSAPIGKDTNDTLYFSVNNQGKKFLQLGSSGRTTTFTVDETVTPPTIEIDIKGPAPLRPSIATLLRGSNEVGKWIARGYSPFEEHFNSMFHRLVTV